MTPLESLTCLSLFILSVYIVWTTSSTYIRGTANVAPHARGLPLVGGTLSLALQGADFIHTCRKRYGDIVRVSLGGQRMTYLFGPDAMKLFFSASDDQIGFRQAGHRALHRQSLWAAITPLLPTSYRPASGSESTAHSCKTSLPWTRTAFKHAA